MLGGDRCLQMRGRKDFARREGPRWLTTWHIPGSAARKRAEPSVAPPKTPEVRQSIQIQAKLSRVGAVLGFQVWLPAPGRARVSDLVPKQYTALVDEIPLSYDGIPIDTIKLIDVLWLHRRSIVRVFEVEHTTAVYSGLLHMADLLALHGLSSTLLSCITKAFRAMRSSPSARSVDIAR